MLDEAGDHIGGKGVCEIGAKVCVAHARCAQLVRIVGCHVGLAVPVLEGAAYGRTYLGVAGKPGLDLAELHALAVDLYHPVAAIDVDVAGLFVVAEDVAGTQEVGVAVLLRKGVGQKGL